MTTPKDELIGLAMTIVEVLDRRCKAGRHKSPWEGFMNANGVEAGTDIERLITKAKRLLQNHI